MRLSSEIMRMLMAGTRKRKTQGEMEKRESRVAYPLAMTLNCPGTIHMKSELSSRKIPITR